MQGAADIVCGWSVSAGVKDSVQALLIDGAVTALQLNRQQLTGPILPPLPSLSFVVRLRSEGAPISASFPAEKKWEMLIIVFVDQADGNDEPSPALVCHSGHRRLHQPCEVYTCGPSNSAHGKYYSSDRDVHCSDVNFMNS